MPVGVRDKVRPACDSGARKISAMQAERKREIMRAGASSEAIQRQPQEVDKTTLSACMRGAVRFSPRILPVAHVNVQVGMDPM